MKSAETDALLARLVAAEESLRRLDATIPQWNGSLYLEAAAMIREQASELAALKHDLAQYQARDAERETRIAELERDAARYRWLRDRCHKEGRDGGWTGSFIIHPVPAWDDTSYSKALGKGHHYDMLDAAIDAAMKEQK